MSDSRVERLRERRWVWSAAGLLRKSGHTPEIGEELFSGDYVALLEAKRDQALQALAEVKEKLEADLELAEESIVRAADERNRAEKALAEYREGLEGHANSEMGKAIEALARSLGGVAVARPEWVDYEAQKPRLFAAVVAVLDAVIGRSRPHLQAALQAIPMPTCPRCDDTGFLCAECQKPRPRCSCGLDGASEDGCPDCDRAKSGAPGEGKR